MPRWQLDLVKSFHDDSILKRKGTMSRFVSCPCQACNQKLEFDAELLDAKTAITCPNCGAETVLIIPEPEPTPKKARFVFGAGDSTNEAKDILDAFLRNEQSLRDTIVKAADSLESTLKFDVASLEDELADDRDISIHRIAEDVANGAQQFLAQNFDQTRLDEFPALELHRVYDREVPRGFRYGKGGAIVPDPGQDWPSRWRAAAQESGDEIAARILRETGRMIALKSSGIWPALGNGAGGYDDALGNPFAPFAINSGFDTDEVSREDAVALGLMGGDDEAEPSKISTHEEIAGRFVAKLRQYLITMEAKRH